MKFYLAGSDSGRDHLVLDGLKNLRLLVSYYYIKNGGGQNVVDWAKKNDIPVFLDSGAFSALMSGNAINLQEYTEYCLCNQHRFDVIASLDVIGDYKETMKNHEKMKSAGVNSITCFHVNEPFSVLKDIYKQEDYIALGVAGMQKRRKQLMAWLVKCFKLRLELNPSCKVHGFALTSPFVMSSFDWYSVDSTTWLMGRIFGKAVMRNGKRIETFGRDDKTRMTRYHHVLKDIMPPRNAKTDDYNALLRHNAKQFLEWASIYK